MSDKKNCNPLESVETHRKYHVDNPLTNMTNRGYTKTILKTDQNNPVVKEYVDAMKRGMNPNPTEKQIREAIKKSNDEQYETFHGHKRPTPPVESWEDSQTCKHCGKEKPLADFIKEKDTIKGRAYECYECYRLRDARRYYSNRPKRLLKDKKRFEDPSTKEKVNNNTKRYKVLYPEKFKARRMFLNAVHAGKIKRQPCVDCKTPEAEGHHFDYSKPLEVIWLCRTHHMERHRKYDPEFLASLKEKHDK